MALRLLIGFDHFATTTAVALDRDRRVVQRFSDVNDMGVQVSTTPFTRGKALYTVDDGWLDFRTDNNYAYGSAGRTVVVGWHGRLDNITNQVQGVITLSNNSSNQGISIWNPSTSGNNRLRFYRDDYGEFDGGTDVFHPFWKYDDATWYHFELMAFVHSTSGWYEFYVDGDLVFRRSGIRTDFNVPWTQIQLNDSREINNPVHFYDDLYVIDDVGDAPTGRLGMPGARIFTFFPRTDAVASDWVVSSGVSSHVMIQDISGPNSDEGGYISTAVDIATDMWQVDASTLPASNEVIAVQTVIKARGSASETLTHVLSAGVTTVAVSSTAFVVSTSVSYMNYIWNFDDWSVAAVSALQFGVVFHS